VMQSFRERIRSGSLHKSKKTPRNEQVNAAPFRVGAHELLGAHG
jgi:hypothetical protein